MNDTIIRILRPESREYNILSEAARVITTHTGVAVAVQNCDFDTGAGMRWTTLVAAAKDHGYTPLSPADQEALLSGDKARYADALFHAIGAVRRINANENGYSDNDKGAFVRDLSVLLGRVPALRNLEVQYGKMYMGGQFLPGYEGSVLPEGGTEYVRFMDTRPDHSMCEYQSISGDSLTAVFADIGKKLADIMF